MSKWYDSKLEDYAEKIGLRGSEFKELELLVEEIVDAEREDAVHEVESPSVGDFVADNYALDILNEMEYADVFEYVSNIESDKKSEEYDYYSSRGV